MYQNLTILAVFAFFCSVASRKLERSPLGGAILFTSFGLALGPLALGGLDLNIDGEGLRTLAELTLALVLFTDAANADLRVLKENIRIPRRLLLFGLPVTILLGFGAGLVLFGARLSWLEIAILATILAPTDAALGKAVVTDESVPSRIREGLNVESGLNDGICVPVLLLFLALAGGTAGEARPAGLALKLVAEEIGIGAAVGAGLAFLSAWILKRSEAKEWLTESWRPVSIPALALASFAAAQWLGGSGFIASFVGGLIFGARVRGSKHEVLRAAEGAGDLMALITWVVFGAAVMGQGIGDWSWQVLLYALLSLTAIRILPVFWALAGLGMRTEEKLFVGWFGPRGLASVVFGIMVMEAHLPGGRTITATAGCTIVLSILAHGLSAKPLAAWLGRRAQTSA